jgi:hypothetical protein
MPYFFSCLTALAKTCSTMLNKSDKSVQPCLGPEPRGKVFIFFPVSVMLAVGLLSTAFIYLFWGY